VIVIQEAVQQIEIHADDVLAKTLAVGKALGVGFVALLAATFAVGFVVTLMPDPSSAFSPLIEYSTAILVVLLWSLLYRRRILAERLDLDTAYVAGAIVMVAIATFASAARTFGIDVDGYKAELGGHRAILIGLLIAYSFQVLTERRRSGSGFGRLLLALVGAVPAGVALVLGIDYTTQVRLENGALNTYAEYLLRMHTFAVVAGVLGLFFLIALAYIASELKRKA
jgi:hypothetical protein